MMIPMIREAEKSSDTNRPSRAGSSIIDTTVIPIEPLLLKTTKNSQKMDKQFDEEGEQSEASKTEVCTGLIKDVEVPMFWRTRPKLWFIRLETELIAYRITSDESKYRVTLRHLDEETMHVVTDILERPLESNKYETLKDALIQTFSDLLGRRVTKVKSDEKKPSVLWQEMRNQAGANVSENYLLMLWLQRLPPNVQKVLMIIYKDVDVTKLVVCADTVADCAKLGDTVDTEERARELEIRLDRLKAELTQVSLELGILKEKRMRQKRSVSRERRSPSREWSSSRESSRVGLNQSEFDEEGCPPLKKTADFSHNEQADLQNAHIRNEPRILHKYIFAAKNVTNSEDSEDKWNYDTNNPNKQKSATVAVAAEFDESRKSIEGQKAQENSESMAKMSNKRKSSKLKKVQFVLPEDKKDQDNMNFQSNSKAAEFIPPSPLSAPLSAPFARGHLLDFVISDFPFKQTQAMDDIPVPSQSEFDEKVCSRLKKTDDLSHKKQAEPRILHKYIFAAENVTDSEDSEDELNYDTNDSKNGPEVQSPERKNDIKSQVLVKGTSTPVHINIDISNERKSSELKKVQFLPDLQEDQKDQDNMNFQLNSEAAKFIPSSSLSSPSSAPLARDYLQDFVISGSPLKRILVMDDIPVPSQSEFDKEVCYRPKEIEDFSHDEYAGVQNNSSQSMDVSDISSVKAKMGDDESMMHVEFASQWQTCISPQWKEKTCNDAGFNLKSDIVTKNNSKTMSLTPDNSKAVCEKDVDLIAVHTLHDNFSSSSSSSSEPFWVLRRPFSSSSDDTELSDPYANEDCTCTRRTENAISTDALCAPTPSLSHDSVSTENFESNIETYRLNSVMHDNKKEYKGHNSTLTHSILRSRWRRMLRIIAKKEIGYDSDSEEGDLNLTSWTCQT